ncbi:dihydroxyacetone kinase subunit DhaL [Kitasatospora purpeofusca]|uniref:dihydroxyacetone kinase subunit DhaL n=1 Tax=Kitasatospora purpeofusca TaxID=67352 RepID=UPI002A5A8B93|nr:dihydroxyacetone kinase subunit DhaL [Kitasatospora purpeofusca]MDY0816124.1 dihydroxyacetone kinase subunit DhaL [Kitasatospora purpeofusca]
MDVDTRLAEDWVRAIAAAVEREHERLTELDSAIGDGDHGSNLRRGFAAVLAALDSPDPAPDSPDSPDSPAGPAPDGGPGALLTRTGSTLISKVGGASGPLYGKAFRAIGAALPPPGRPGADAAGLGEALAAGLRAVRDLGRAAPGDKTVVDAWTPALDAYREAVAAGAGLPEATAAAAGGAERGALDTVPLQARKGRASYLGPRSVGHQDPGAASTALLFRALAEATAARAAARGGS